MVNEIPFEEVEESCQSSECRVDWSLVDMQMDEELCRSSVCRILRSVCRILLSAVDSWIESSFELQALELMVELKVLEQIIVERVVELLVFRMTAGSSVESSVELMVDE